MNKKLWVMLEAWQKLNTAIYYLDGELHLDPKRLPERLFDLRVAATYAMSKKDDYEATEKTVRKIFKRDSRLPVEEK